MEKGSRCKSDVDLAKKIRRIEILYTYLVRENSEVKTFDIVNVSVLSKQFTLMNDVELITLIWAHISSVGDAIVYTYIIVQRGSHHNIHY